MNKSIKSIAIAVSLIAGLGAHKAQAQSDGAKQCPPVEIVFTMDTSGSMSDEAEALCATISQVTQELAAKNIEASSVIWGVTDTYFSCLESSTLTELGDEVPGDNGACGQSLSSGSGADENWGPSTAIIAERFPWSDDSVRVIVPISDEGPCFGDGCTLDGPDGDAIANAIELAKNNQVFVSPIVGTGASSCPVQLAQELATKTGGTSFLSQDPNLDIAQAVTALVEDACQTALACELSAEQRIFAPGSDASLKVAFSEGDAPATGRQVQIDVLEGPNSPAQVQGQTRNDGSAELVYQGGPTPGADRVQATCIDSSGREQKSVNSELIFWDSDCDRNGIADTCDLSCDNFDGLCSEVENCGLGQDQDADGLLDVCSIQIPAVCGDGVLGGDETCDDGNNVDGDGCSAQCERESGIDCPTIDEDLLDGLRDLVKDKFPWRKSPRWSSRNQ